MKHPEYCPNSIQKEKYCPYCNNSSHEHDVNAFFSTPTKPNSIDVYRKAIRKFPDCIWNRVYLAKAFYFSGQYREMAPLLDYIFEQDRFPPVTYILKAHLHCIYEEYYLAEESYIKAVKMNSMIQDKWLENQLWGLKYDQPRTIKVP